MVALTGRSTDQADDLSEIQALKWYREYSVGKMRMSRSNANGKSTLWKSLMTSKSNSNELLVVVIVVTSLVNLIYILITVNLRLCRSQTAIPIAKIISLFVTLIVVKIFLDQRGFLLSTLTIESLPRLFFLKSRLHHVVSNRDKTHFIECFNNGENTIESMK